MSKIWAHLACPQVNHVPKIFILFQDFCPGMSKRAGYYYKLIEGIRSNQPEVKASKRFQSYGHLKFCMISNWFCLCQWAVQAPTQCRAFAYSQNFLHPCLSLSYYQKKKVHNYKSIANVTPWQCQTKILKRGGFVACIRLTGLASGNDASCSITTSFASSRFFSLLKASSACGKLDYESKKFCTFSNKNFDNSINTWLVSKLLYLKHL